MPRIFCWVMTDKALLNKTNAVKETWIQHCDGAIAISSTTDDGTSLGVDVPQGKDHIADKAKLGWISIYQSHFNEADYFMKVDPDTYVIVDNLKRYLHGRDPSQPEYFGHHFTEIVTKRTYMSGGPGYVLSKEALKLLVTKAFHIKPTCIPDGQGKRTIFREER